MNINCLNRRTDAWLMLWTVLLVSIVSSDAGDCGDGYITIDVEGECTNSTCIGECRNTDTCCLERCFDGTQPTSEDFTGCATDTDTTGGCRFYENQTECLASNLNKTFAVCWKHVVYYIASHPDAERISGFNPVLCPCDTGQRRKPGTCSFSQCVHDSVCEERTDFILDENVCCIDDDIFPKSDDCDKSEKLENSVHKYLNVSTIVQCQELCQGGLCKMPNPARLPACCKSIPKTAEGKDDGGLDGGVIALIVIIILILIAVGIFAVFYLYRIKKEDTQRKRARNSGSVEVTNLDGIIEKVSAWNEEGATHSDNFSNPEYIDSEKYTQSRDDHVTVPDFSARVYSHDKLEDYVNPGFSGYNESSDEDQTYNSFRRHRTGSSVSGELGTDVNNIQYVFDDGKGSISNDNVQHELDERTSHSSEGNHGE